MSDREQLNAHLIRGLDLAKRIGHKVEHDFKKLWDYMTHPNITHVDVEHVMQELEALKSALQLVTL